MVSLLPVSCPAVRVSTISAIEELGDRRLLRRRPLRFVVYETAYRLRLRKEGEAIDVRRGILLVIVDALEFEVGAIEEESHPGRPGALARRRQHQSPVVAGLLVHDEVADARALYVAARVERAAEVSRQIARGRITIGGSLLEALEKHPGQQRRGLPP